MTKRLERRAVARLVADMGADVMLKFAEVATLSPRQRLAKRAAVEETIRLWGEEHPEQQTVMPEWSPYKLERLGRVAIIGPSPSWEDAKHGELGWSRSERTLLRELKQLDVPGHMVTMLTAVCHWTNTGPRTNRPPTGAELADNRGILMAALDAADVDHVLLHGAHALHAWRPDLTIEQCAGNTYLWRHRWFVTPMMHTSVMLRDEVTQQRTWAAQVAHFVNDLYDPRHRTQHFSTRCHKKNCTGDFFSWDETAVAWCHRHFEPYTEPVTPTAVIQRSMLP